MNTKTYLIGFDLDGTLLTSDKKITERSLKALAKAAENGNCCVPVTGRPFSGVPQELKILPAVRYIICSSGAVIYDTKTGNIVHRNTLPGDICLNLYRMVCNYEVMFEIFHNGFGYQSEQVHKAMLERFMGSSMYTYIRKSRKSVSDFESHLIRYRDKIDMISIMCASRKEKQKTMRCLHHFTHVNVTSPSENDLEIVSDSAGKGNALLWLAEKLMIPANRIVAIGDSDNDRDMFSCAGISIAMGNADEKIKASADYITEDNDHEGVAYAVSRLYNL